MNLSTQTVRLKGLGVLSVGLITGAVYGIEMEFQSLESNQATSNDALKDELDAMAD